jgi:hypothetical protein
MSIARDKQEQLASPAEKYEAAKAVKAKKVGGVLGARKKAAGDGPPPVEFSENYNTAQIYSQGFEFAFMTLLQGVWKQVCTFVYCKDFLHDLVWAFVNKTKWSIYGFNYDTSKNLPLEMNHTVFAFRNNQMKDDPRKFHERRETCQSFLNQIEEKLGFEPSKIFEVPHPQGPCWLIIGDKCWQHAPPILGLFTLFIRVGFAHDPKESYETTLENCRSGKFKITASGVEAGFNDPGYVKESWIGLQAFLKHGTETFYPTIEENYPEDLPKKLNLHNAVGPVNWSKGSAKVAMPRWYEKF